MTNAALPLRQHQHVNGLARVHLDHPLGHDGQRVGLAERGHLVGALAGQRGDEAALVL